MRHPLYIVAGILMLVWAIGVFAFAAGPFIHILLFMAIVLFLMKFIRVRTQTIPKGLRPTAQGCRVGEATLGRDAEVDSTATRLWRMSLWAGIPLGFSERAR